MPNVYVKPTALSNVRGRVNYISSEKKQEHLVAVFSATDKQFWRDLSEHCRKAAAEAGHSKVCEGREWHGALPNEYAKLYEGRETDLAKEISELLKNITGTENITALHWNKTKTNFHFHSVCAENKEVNEVTYGAVLTRNTYYNAEGKRATKKECVGADGKLLPGCELLLKGEQKVTMKRFGPKEDLRLPEVNERVRKELVEKFNQDLQTDIFTVFIDDGIHLKQQHVGHKLSDEKKATVEAKNALIRDFNKTADEILEVASKISESEFLKATGQLKFIRRDVKKYAMKSTWLESIKFYLDQLKENLAVLQKTLSERKTSLKDMIKSAGSRAGNFSNKEREPEL